MASELRRGSALVAATGWRLLGMVALAALAVTLARDGAALSATLLAAAAGLVAFDGWRLTMGNADSAAPPRAGAEDARRLEEALALIDGVSAALFVTAPDGRIAFVNRAARALAGPEPGRLDDIPALGAEGVRVVAALPPGARRLIQGVDGRALLVSIEELVTPAAAPRRLVSVQPVAGELDAVQLAAWRRMTQVLAHELMNSLTPVTSLAESLSVMTANGADPRVSRAAGTIARRSAHLLSFVDRYRQVADLPAPAPVEIAMAALLADLDGLVGAELRAGGVEFTVAAPADLTLKADPVLLEQALLNLVRNAAEAVAGRADPAIRVSADARLASVVITIEDNGPGFAEAEAEELFVPFFTTKPNGAGIGLSLVREIAAAHGGRVRAITTSSGASFEVELPG